MNSGLMIKLVLIAVGAYLMGDINPSILIGKLKGIDIRKEGSGNAGMTNTIRVMGVKYGIAVLIVDVMKAFIAVRIGFAAADTYGAMVAFAAVVLGHCYPAFFGFKGGKGVAASLGAAFALNWQSALLVLLVAAVLFLLFRRMSVASMGAAIAYPVLIHRFAPEYFYFSVAAAIFLLVMHRENIGRLLRGEEPKLTIGHKGEKNE